MADNNSFFADNQANWDDRAAHHEASGYGTRALIDNPTHISHTVRMDMPHLGDLSGLDVAHLQCHLGTDTISLSQLGARRVIGLDFSAEAVARARRISQECSSNAEFVQANVYDAREALSGDFDLVYTSVGVLCWLPKIDAWAETVSSLLRPGGRFYIRDDHPMRATIDDDVSSGFLIARPYFETHAPTTWDVSESYVEPAPGAPEITHTVQHEWNHSLSEVITALIRAGLVIATCSSRIQTGCRWSSLSRRTDRSSCSARRR